MGQKVDPRGFRLALNKDWKSIWHDDRHYADLLHEDIKIRQFIDDKLKRAGVHQVRIHRSINEIRVEVVVAKPGLVIGRGGSGVERLTGDLKKIVSGKLAVSVMEHKKPGLSAKLLAEVVVSQVERGYPYKRAMAQMLQRAREAGAAGVKVELAGRLGGARIARNEKAVVGSVPTSTLRANVDFARATAHTKRGTIGVKAWIYQKDQEKGNG